MSVFLKKSASFTFCITLILSTIIFASIAVADCTTEDDGRTKTCTGDITASESLVVENTYTPLLYTLIIEDLTSSEASTGGDFLFRLGTTSADGDSSERDATEAGATTFKINLDTAVTNFSADARNGVAVSVSSIGGKGQTASESSGGGERTGGSGGRGGKAGEVIVEGESVILRGSEIALEVFSSGGQGGNGGEGFSTESGKGNGGTGGSGGDGGEINVTFTDLTLKSADGNGDAVAQIISMAGDAGTGGVGKAFDDTATGGDGGVAGDGGDITVTLNGEISFETIESDGFLLQSIGGTGGNGGEGDNESLGTGIGGDGNEGGAGGTVNLMAEADTTISTSGSETPGTVFRLESIAGSGGNGGKGTGGGDGIGGNGGQGGAAGDVTLDLSEATTNILSIGTDNHAVIARSYGQEGGNGGTGDGIDGQGGTSEGTGPAGKVTVEINGSITTSGDGADTIFAQSIGGFAGSGGTGSGIEGYGGGTESAGDAGNVKVTWTGDSSSELKTDNERSYAVTAQSIGGGGGKGGKGSGLGSLGGSGSAGGDGKTVTVTTTGETIFTNGGLSTAISAQSIGGGGGDGGGASAIVTIGGSGSNAGEGGIITLTNSAGITTEGTNSVGIFAQSIGGGGGTAYTTDGVISAIGGSGSTGGTGGSVTVTNTGDITTNSDYADAIFAQSVGNGGGRGSNVVSGSVVYSQAIGGSGGTGGDGGNVSVLGSANGPTLTTSGDSASGIVAQSVGGGGGHGGNAYSVSASVTPTIDIALGGSGGAAGEGGAVEVEFFGSISTGGENSLGISATSSAGGGGTAGTTVAITESPSATFDLSTGGDGGGGGNAGAVTACFGQKKSIDFCKSDSRIDAGSIETDGSNSHGIYAGSHGGSGGHSGLTLSVTPETLYDIDVAVGGSGGEGGIGEAVEVYTNGFIKTQGENSKGILAKSVGGGGGGAYMSSSVTGFTASGLNLSVGGEGGSTSGSRDVTVVADGNIETDGANSDAISAYSNGGNGGSGGISIEADAFSGSTLGISLGGSGGDGGESGDVAVTWNGSTLSTSGSQSVGISAMSIGGSGGRGGLSIDGAAANIVSGDLSIGGSGSTGGEAGTVTVITTDSSATIKTKGDQASAIAASSTGGGGGHGGGSITSTLVSYGDVNFSIGGDGGVAGAAGAVTVTNVAGLTTEAATADGISALSVGGSGGVGGYSIEAGISASAIPEVPAGNLSVTVGGTGGDGSAGEEVTVNNTGGISTGDFNSYGIFSQSMGGSGGRGGSAYSGMVNADTSIDINLDFSFGGEGGEGASGNEVSITNSGGIKTTGGQSTGIFAQSLGGNGGAGGNSYSALMTYSDSSSTNLTAETNIGGSGGDGSTSDAVIINNSGTVATQGASSTAIFGQSAGGGGGAGGNGGNFLFNYSSAAASSSSNIALQLGTTIGGSGGTGGDGSTVVIINEMGGTLSTVGDSSHGIWGQSLGGGGGDGGIASNYSLSVTGTCSVLSGGDQNCSQSNGASTSVSASLNVNVGGSGGVGGDGAETNISNDTAMISTEGDASHAMFAQSIGGGGGAGGSGGTGIGAFTTNTTADIVAAVIKGGESAANPYALLTSYKNISIGIGGKGGAAGDGAEAEVSNAGTLSTEGTASHGIFAQSVGGGGGSGGAASAAFIYGIGVGGSGEGGGDGGEVSVTNASGASIETSGRGSFGILAQSVGGGGGENGAKGKFPLLINTSVDIEVGGSDGISGAGGEVTVTNTDTEITTKDAAAIGIFAQSVGGGGGLSQDGLNGGTGTATVGGSGDSEGNGADVTVSHSGTIETGKNLSKSTENAASHGILAQSIGGGGGYAGSVLMGSADNFGVSDTETLLLATTGNGGTVSVTLSGDLTTYGISSVGIFAQSVGGGGGVTGSTDLSSTSASDAAVIGSNLGEGYGGAVSVELESSGSITTSGAGAHGIFAQSASGATTSTDSTVDVTVSGDVTASGGGAHGIYAQTAGDAPVTVTVNEGATVTGGTTATIEDAETGSGVYVKGYDDIANTIINKGEITSTDGSSGIAVTFDASSTGSLTVENSGTIIGDVINATQESTLVLASKQGKISIKNSGLIEGSIRSDGDKVIEVENAKDATINLGDTFDADHVENYGIIDVAALENAGTSILSGDFNHRSGSLLFDLKFSEVVGGENDKLTTEGTIEFDLNSLIVFEIEEDFAPEVGTFFDLVVAEDIIFETENDTDFDFFDYVDTSFIDEENWMFSLVEENQSSLSFAVQSELAEYLQTSEILRLTKIAPVPVPGAVYLFGSVLALGGVFLRRRRAS